MSQEESHALSLRILPTHRPAGDPLAAVTPGAATRAGVVGLRHDPGSQRLSTRGTRGLAGVCPLAHAPRAPARVDLRWGGQACAVSGASRGASVLRAAVALGTDLVAGGYPGAGDRRHPA